jgi:hypothetical protein
MTAMLIAWLVLAVAVLTLAVVTRIYPLVMSSLGMGFAAVLAWQQINIGVQVGVALVSLVLGVFFWFQQTRPSAPSAARETTGHLSGLGGLSDYSAFSDGTDEVRVDSWESKDQALVYFRGRQWKARLAKGAKARIGLYRVKEVRDGWLVLIEVIH